jgi:hypothetical protein
MTVGRSSKACEHPQMKLLSAAGVSAAFPRRDRKPTGERPATIGFADMNRPGDSGDSLAWMCYWKVPVSTISRAYQAITGGFVAQSKCQNALFSIHLRFLEYASSNQGVRGSNPFGRTYLSQTNQ